jgi:uncharacterized protein YdeI (YjbR/CyaY-like superfamily)
MDATYFESRESLRAWLAENHALVGELWVGFYKKGSGRPSVTYPEALEEALCFGWIDGVRHAVDADRFKQRFTPRRRGSKWSAVNVRRVEALLATGLMQPAGIAAFEARDPGGTQHSYERGTVELSAEYEAALQGRPRAWAFFESQPPWYRRTASAWVMDAKQEQPRLRRLEALASECEAGQWIGPLRRARGGKAPPHAGSGEGDRLGQT